MKRLLLLLIPAVMAACEGAKISSLAPAPLKIILPEGRDLTWYKEKYPEATGVYLSYKKNVEHNDGQWMQFESRYIILDPNDRDLTTFELRLPSSVVLTQCAIAVQNPGAIPRTYNQYDLKRQTDSRGVVTLKLAYPDVKAGTTVAVHYETHLGASHPAPSRTIDLLRKGLPSDTTTISYIFPGVFHVSYKSGKNHKVKEHKDFANEKTILTLAGKDIPALTGEDFSPYYLEWAEFMHVSGAKGASAAAINSFAGLKSALERYLFPSDPFGVAMFVDDRLKALGFYEKSDSAKVFDAARLVSDTIELDNWRSPATPQNVYTARKANAASMSQLLYYMYRRLGLNAILVIGSGAENGELTSTFVTLDEFDEPGVIVQLANKDYFIQPYKKYLPVGVITYNMVERDALIIRHTIKEPVSNIPFRRLNPGYMGSPRPYNATEEPTKVSIAALNPGSNESKAALRIVLNEDGSAAVHERIEFTGMRAYMMRTELNEEGAKLQEWVLKNYVAYDLSQVKPSRQEFLNLKERDKPLVLELEYTIPDLLNISDSELVFQTGGFLSQDAIQMAPPDKGGREAPISIRKQETRTRSIEIVAPKGWSCTTPIDNASGQNRFGSRSTVATRQDNTVQITYVRRLNKIEAPKESIAELNALIGPGTALQIPYLVFSRQP